MAGPVKEMSVPNKNRKNVVKIEYFGKAH